MNPYDSPEKFGLELIGEIEWSDENYQFDKTVVWRNDATSEFLIASDSGCSCPLPFEGTSLADLQVVSYASLSNMFNEKLRDPETHNPLSDKVIDLLIRLRRMGLR